MCGEFYQILKEETVTIFYNLFQKTEAKVKFFNSFYKANDTLTQSGNAKWHFGQQHTAQKTVVP